MNFIWLFGLVCSIVAYYLSPFRSPGYVPNVEYYFIFLCILGSAGFFIRPINTDSSKKNFKIFISIFLVTLVIRLIFLEKFSTWLDEEYQLVSASRQPFKTDQHQPPLEFIFEHLLIKAFGFISYLKIN